MTIDISYPWSTVAPYTTCTSSNPRGMQCVRADQAGEIIWRFQPV